MISCRFAPLVAADGDGDGIGALTSFILSANDAYNDQRAARRSSDDPVDMDNDTAVDNDGVPQWLLVGFRHHLIHAVGVMAQMALQMVVMVDGALQRARWLMNSLPRMCALYRHHTFIDY